MVISNCLFSLTSENPADFPTWCVLAKLSANPRNYSQPEPLAVIKKYYKMKQSIAFLCAVCFIMNINAQVTVSTNDFKIFDNTNCEGTLTYIDYQSGKPTDVATTMQVKVTEKTI